MYLRTSPVSDWSPVVYNMDNSGKRMNISIIKEAWTKLKEITAEFHRLSQQ